MSDTRSTAGERGASIVELALIAPVMVLLVFGVIDLARGYRLQIQAENAAREGAAYAQVRPNDVDCASHPDIRERALAEESSLSSNPGFHLAVWGQNGGSWQKITGCGGSVAEAKERVRVDVTVRFDVMTPIVERVVGGTIDLTGSAEVRVQR